MNILLKHHIGRVPVVKMKKGRRVVVGIISKADIVRAYKKVVD